MTFSNQQTERNKLNNRKQSAIPSPTPTSTHCGCVQKQSMPQRTVIKIETKIPKRNQTSTHICHGRLSATKRGKTSQREREISFSDPATKRTSNRIKFADTQNNNETHLTLHVSVAERYPNKERSIDKVGLKFNLFLLHSHHNGSP